MIRIFSLLFWGMISLSVLGQKKLLKIEDIYSNLFKTNRLDALHSLKNGKDFTILNYENQNKSCVEVYDYASFSKQKTLVCSDEISDFRIDSYEFSNDEQKILLGGDFAPIYRHSQQGKYYVFDLKTRERKAVFDKKIQEPTFSPDGKKVAFVFDNNLYINDLERNNISQITFDGEKNKIINGIADWVYEEEFSIVRMFEWSNDSQKLAFIRFDEQEVPEFSMDIYGSGLYPYPMQFKYPKAGEKNSEVSAMVYHLNENKTTTINTQSAYYIPRLKWTNDAHTLSLQTLNRNQNHFELVFFNTENQQKIIVYTEKNNSYVELPSVHFLENNSFLISSEKDGFNHLYLYDKGKQLQQITKGNWEVTNFYGFDPKQKIIYYQSTERGSIYRDVYSISLKGKKTLLSKHLGTNSAEFSHTFSYFIGQHQSAKTPPSASVFETSSLKEVKKIADNTPLIDKINAYTNSRKEFQQLQINGNSLNAWILKPENFNPNKKYPLLMYQYSGPGSQSVSDTWLKSDDLWHLSLTQKGYIVICVDGRGTGYKGTDFKKITQLQLGKYETIDQIAVAEYFSKLSYIDPNRIGIWGWSFGGFTSTNCLLKGNHIFKMAIAVAPVTNWRFYDTIYTERYMTTPAENPTGYDDNSPLNFASLLKGKYLLIHGSADDNVHLQNATRLVEELVQNNKTFDWAFYPDKNHGIYGGNTRIHLFEKMTKFILENL